MRVEFRGAWWPLHICSANSPSNLIKPKLKQKKPKLKQKKPKLKQTNLRLKQKKLKLKQKELKLKQKKPKLKQKKRKLKPKKPKLKQVVDQCLVCLALLEQLEKITHRAEHGTKMDYIW